jgi:hypothetical protein
MKWITAILAILLIASNGYWLYQKIDAGVTLSYRNQELHDNLETEKQILSALPELAKGKSRTEIIEILKANTDREPYEKNGCVWVGWVGLKFSDKDELLSISRVWNSGESDPCYPAS